MCMQHKLSHQPSIATLNIKNIILNLGSISQNIYTTQRTGQSTPKQELRLIYKKTGMVNCI